MAPEGTETAHRGQVWRRTGPVRIGEFGWIWIATAALFALSAAVAPGTLRAAALAAMLPFAAILAIMAVGQTVVVQQRGLDLSCASLMSLGGLAVAKFGFWTGSIPLAVLLTLASAAAAGALNGAVVARLNVTPIVATLATNALFLGAILTLSGGSPITVPRPLAAFAHERVLGAPSMLLVALGFILFVAAVTGRTVVGRRFVAVGANPRAAAAAGIPVEAYLVGAYAAAAVCYAVAGMLYAGFIGSASHIAGNDYLLPAIAAVVIGGTRFTGGRGSAIASGVAALFLVQLGQMVLALGASAAVQMLVQAGAIVVAMAIRGLPVRPGRP